MKALPFLTLVLVIAAMTALSFSDNKPSEKVTKHDSGEMGVIVVFGGIFLFAAVGTVIGCWCDYSNHRNAKAHTEVSHDQNGE